MFRCIGLMRRTTGRRFEKPGAARARRETIEEERR
jgi:hypothetical protein